MSTIFQKAPNALADFQQRMIGSMRGTDAERKALAATSHAWNLYVLEKVSLLVLFKRTNKTSYSQEQIQNSSQSYLIMLHQRCEIYQIWDHLKYQNLQM